MFAEAHLLAVERARELPGWVQVLKDCLAKERWNNMNHATFPNYRTYETTLGGRKLKVELGKLAGLANGAALVSYGDTTVLATVTMAKSPAMASISSPCPLTTKRSCTPSAASPAALCAAKAVPAKRPSWPPA